MNIEQRVRAGIASIALLIPSISGSRIATPSSKIDSYISSARSNLQYIVTLCREENARKDGRFKAIAKKVGGKPESVYTMEFRFPGHKSEIDMELHDNPERNPYIYVMESTEGVTVTDKDVGCDGTIEAGLIRRGNTDTGYWLGRGNGTVKDSATAEKRALTLEEIESIYERYSSTIQLARDMIDQKMGR